VFVRRRNDALPIGFTPLEKAEPDTDRWAIENGWISSTPLRLDLTDETALGSIQSVRWILSGS
jgi:broad specificity polyphosphatase/5'/3'-nucleotidase SurE